MSKWILINGDTLLNLNCLEIIKKRNLTFYNSTQIRYCIDYCDKNNSILKTEDFENEEKQLNRFEEMKKLLLWEQK